MHTVMSFHGFASVLTVIFNVEACLRIEAITDETKTHEICMSGEQSSFLGAALSEKFNTAMFVGYLKPETL